MVPEQREVVARDGRSVLLRSIRAADAEAFIEHRTRTCGETDFLAVWPDEVTITPDEERALVAKTRADPRMASVVAELGGRFVGMAGVAPVHEHEKCAHRAQACVSVERAAWGVGIGGALMRRCVELARELGYVQLELGVYAQNARARALYERLGFVEIGRIPRAFVHRDGSYHDEVQLALALDA